MTPYDAYGLDYSGYGPTGGGNAPSAHQMRMQMMNKYHSDRMSSAMQFIDPYITAAGMTAQQIVAGSNSPAQARRALYSSAGGQAALDAAMAARRLGALGQGDPVNYSTNVVSGIAGGGFTTSFGGTVDGRSVFGQGQRVTGQGAISERVAMSYQKGLLEDLYGKGTPDPSKLRGFDMEEASRVFSTIARRGGVGHAAHVERNASGMTRLAAGIDGAVDPLVKEAMEKVRAEMSDTQASATRRAKIMSSATAEEKQRYTSDPAAMDSAEMLEISKNMSGLDAKQREAVNKLANAPDAVFVNKSGRQKVAKVVEQTIEGMASLADVYGELSSPELHQKLEELSGMRITNFSQAKQATAMVNQLRGAAEISGMDPRAFMEFAASTQASLQGSVMRINGYDDRTATQAKSATAQMNTQMLTDAAVTAKMAAQEDKQAADLGLRTGLNPTTDEIYADLRQGREFFMEEYKAASMTMGGTSHMSKGAQTKLAGLMKEFEDAGSTENPTQRRAELEQQMRAVYAEDASRDGRYHTFDEVSESRTAKVQLSAAQSNKVTSDKMADMTMEQRLQDTNINPLLNKLSKDGTVSDEDARGLGTKILKNVSAKGLMDLKEASKDPKLQSAGAVRTRQQQIMKQAGLDGAEGEKFLETFFDKDGKIKNEQTYNETIDAVRMANWTPGQSKYERESKASNQIDMLGANSQGVRLREGEKSVSLNSIITSLATGKASGVQDQESMALSIQALAEAGTTIPDVGLTDAEGNPVLMRDSKGEPILDDKGKVQVKKVNMAKESASNIDFSGGLNKEGMEKLERVYGGDLGLHTKLGYKTKEEMYKATSESTEAKRDALNSLYTDETYGKLNIRGKADSITAISDDAFAASKNGDIQKITGQMAAIRSLKGEGMMSDGQISDLEAKAQKGTLSRGDFGMFEAEKAATEIEDRHWGIGTQDSKGNQVARMGDNLGRIKNLAWTTTKAQGPELANLAKLNNASGGDLVENMERQLKNLETTEKETGATQIEYQDGSKKGYFNLGESSKDIEALKDAINKLREASAQEKGEKQAEVMHVTTLKVENWERK